jgi:hypothetical protein
LLKISVLSHLNMCLQSPSLVHMGQILCSLFLLIPFSLQPPYYSFPCCSYA